MTSAWNSSKLMRGADRSRVNSGAPRNASCQDQELQRQRVLMHAKQPCAEVVPR